ncbi:MULTISPECIES: pyridoxal kinase PdxY [Vibrio]|uniref:Pyridoxal kinase PdxY n=2 Tax=Vibrio TaxID=662 RepID=A0A7X4LH39_9VIBR|nr:MULTISPECIES: pyridoxal kinase PdxY [Vibrio]MBF9001545.1 pyridoxal kinase PdxY [Vibrio nitrifigilis]MZI91781.1 pyridoxal kinase PdxY [Vibrio eleionomae]
MQGILSIQSHVSYGHAGNSSAVFPMQRMGFEVWPIHTVQFSNHTHYTQGWTGHAFTADDIAEVVRGLANLDVLTECQAVVTGYQGTAEQCSVVADTVAKVKQANPNALYVCDPVMSNPEKGCIVAPGITEQLINTLIPIADVIVPNQFELSQIANMEINSLEDAVKACHKALTKGPKLIIAKHLHGIDKQNFNMMLATKDGVYLAKRPLYQICKEPIGVGDLITSIFTAGLLKGWSPLQAFQHCHDAVHGVLKTTFKSGEWELQTIAAQDELINPSEHFPAELVEQHSESYA